MDEERRFPRIKVHEAWVRRPCIHCGCYDFEVELILPEEPHEKPMSHVFCCACGEQVRNEDVGL